MERSCAPNHILKKKKQWCTVFVQIIGRSNSNILTNVDITTNTAASTTKLHFHPSNLLILCYLVEYANYTLYIHKGTGITSTKKRFM